jgi:DNA-directed RNA polymerase I subunit RPA2
MPFSESGMTPDVIINPHAFPSRMTIGMLVESMAGKASAIHGYGHDATPFTMQGDDPGRMAVDYFGSQLAQAGYSYYGSEPMYSGVLGCELHCDIYIGVVYYQRLRHMVLDKAQVRSTGPVDVVTRQPIHGRKRNGGVRFGEMERDSLVAHGTAFLTQDRLLNCSDRHTAHVCCGSLLSAHSTHVVNAAESIASSGTSAMVNGDPLKQQVKCRLCGRCDQWKLITVPYAFRYLTNELAAMGIRLEFSV